MVYLLITIYFFLYSIYDNHSKLKMINFPKINQKKKFKSYAKNYFSSMQETYNNINLNELSKINNSIFNIIKSKKRIFIVGNGGSAAVANHFTCDFNKGIYLSSEKKLNPKLFSLSS